MEVMVTSTRRRIGGPRGRMLRLCAALALLAGCRSSRGGAEEPQPGRGPFTKITLPSTQVRPLPRSANGRDYQLLVALPDSFADEPERRYPVLYLCDGYWDLPLVRSIAQSLFVDGVVPEMVVVGFDYAGDNPRYGRLRRWDLTPTPATYRGAEYDGPSGHAQDFLYVIEHEIIPLVERDYRGDPGYRVLAGSSLGGLFSLYAMFARPGLFAGHVAVSPAAQWADDWLFGFEEKFWSSRQPLGARLFMSAAAEEVAMIREGVQRFDARLRQRNYPGFSYSYRLIEEERHAGTKAEGYTRGLRFAFLPRAPGPHDP